MSRSVTRKEPVLRSVDSALRQGDPVLRPNEPPLRDVTLTTTSGVEGRPVAAYLGIVTGEVILSADLLQDAPSGFFGRLRRRSASGEASLAEARETALRDIRGRAAAKGADAVVGIAFTMAVLGDRLVVSASGTAVRLG